MNYMAYTNIKFKEQKYQKQKMIFYFLLIISAFGGV